MVLNLVNTIRDIRLFAAFVIKGVQQRDRS